MFRLPFNPWGAQEPEPSSGSITEHTPPSRPSCHLILVRWAHRISALSSVVFSNIGKTAAIVAMAVLAVRAIMRIEVRWDTFMYHIPFAAIRGGLGIPYEMNDKMRVLYETFPPLPHIVQGIFWRVSGTLNATGVVNYLAFSLFLAYCHCVLKARGWLVALISLTAPLVVIHSTTSYVDLFGNSFLSIALSSCLYGVTPFFKTPH